jgi:YHS domain-containing protein
MKEHYLWFVVAFTLALAPCVAAAQHDAHQPGAVPAAPEMAQCARVQPVVGSIIAAATDRLESSRQSNSPAEMRAAVDHLQAALRDIRTQLTPCSAPPSQPAPAAADPHAGHTTTPAQVTPKSAPAATPAPKQMDPVNGLMVDPATSPQTTYEGTTYYFSSEQTRKEFLANPAKFAKKPRG